MPLEPRYPHGSLAVQVRDMGSKTVTEMLEINKPHKFSRQGLPESVPPDGIVVANLFRWGTPTRILFHLS